MSNRGQPPIGLLLLLNRLQFDNQRRGDPWELANASELVPGHWVRETASGAGAVSLSLTRIGSEGPPRHLWTLDGGDGSSPLLAELARLIGSRGVRGDLPKATTAAGVRKILERELLFRDVEGERGRDQANGVVGRTGVLFGGVIANVKSNLPFYASDFKDGLQRKVLSSTLFMYFACLAPAVAFGGLIATMTHGQIGVVEMMVSTAICGVVYALLAGQPLTILGSTGPVIIFIALLYDLCQRLDLPFMPTLSWVGFWTSGILIVLAATEASRLIRWFTRFTDEIFAALISLIFIYEALADTLGGLRDPATPKDSALLAVVLALGTYTLATQLAQFRRTPFLSSNMRHLLADFGPAIAIVLMTIASTALEPVTVEILPVPAEFGTTSGRPWLVHLGAAPLWVKLGAVVPALLVSVLLFLDQNITVRLVNNPRNSLRKGFGYHLDLLVVGVLVGVCAVFGLPWMVAATVRSLNHVQSLATVESKDGKETVVSVVENRVTGLLIHVLIGISILFLTDLRTVPMPVLFGLFLYMGIASMHGNQLFERIKLWFTDPEQFPATYYLRSVPKKVVHTFTAIQVVLLALLWVLKTSSLGILFPLLIALLVPVRLYLARHFDAQHLALLDAEEEPEYEQDAVLGP